MKLEKCLYRLSSNSPMQRGYVITCDDMSTRWVDDQQIIRWTDYDGPEIIPTGQFMELTWDIPVAMKQELPTLESFGADVVEKIRDLVNLNEHRYDFAAGAYLEAHSELSYNEALEVIREWLIPRRSYDGTYPLADIPDYVYQEAKLIANSNRGKIGAIKYLRGTLCIVLKDAKLIADYWFQ